MFYRQKTLSNHGQTQTTLSAGKIQDETRPGQDQGLCHIPGIHVGRGALRPSFGAEYQRTNAILLAKLEHTDNQLAEYNHKHPNQITKDVIRDLLEDKPLTRVDKGKDFVELASERLESEYKRNRIGRSRYSNGLSSLKMLGEFLISTGRGTHKPNGIYVGEMSPELIDALIDWRRTVKGNSDHTINHALTPILKCCAYAAATPSTAGPTTPWQCDIIEWIEPPPLSGGKGGVDCSSMLIFGEFLPI